ncbi:MAG: response regulator transcription factor [Bacillota bacterium]|nr:response regulator transcription factor [Bacillota bacterium]
MNKNEKTVLVVDDEEKISEVVKAYLEHDGYLVVTAFNGKAALDAYEILNPSLIILDLMLPDISGTEICKILRERSKVPIIMLTARTGEEDILNGLDIGADDYVTKPFSPKQLVARVKALFRRSEAENHRLSSVKSFNNGDLVINTSNYEVIKNKSLINLTPIEYKILITLAKRPFKVFTRDELIYFAFEGKYEGYERTIDSHIKNLRQKIETNSKNPDYILTIRGIGYKFGGIESVENIYEA